MNNTVVTTVIGSYPATIDRQNLMNSYEQGIIPPWNPYIKKAVFSFVIDNALFNTPHLKFDKMDDIHHFIPDR